MSREESRPHQGDREIRSAGQRAAGGTFQKCSELAGREMRKSFLYSHRYDVFPLESCMLGNGPAQFGKGATEKGQRGTSPVPYFIRRGPDEKGVAKPPRRLATRLPRQPREVLASGLVARHAEVALDCALLWWKLLSCHPLQRLLPVGSLSASGSSTWWQEGHHCRCTYAPGHSLSCLIRGERLPGAGRQLFL